MRYEINAKILAEYTKENVNYILEQGAKKGFAYYAFGPETLFATIDLAASGLMQPNEFGGRCIMAKMNEIVIDICIVDIPGMIEISIGNFDHEDLLSKIHFFLSMIKDFAIVEINTRLD